MANKKQSEARRLKMGERAQLQKELHFEKVPEGLIWHRKRNDGYTTLPRSMPLAMQAIDEASKGNPSGHTLFCLWARSPDHALITIENPSTFASEAGFHGKRAADTWRKRMKRLRELGFILTKEGASGEFHYVLLINPNAAMQRLFEKGLIQKGLYGRFVDRLADIGALEELPTTSIVWKAFETASTSTTDDSTATVTDASTAIDKAA